MEKTPMDVKEFVRKILAGERNFDNIELHSHDLGPDLCKDGSIHKINKALLRNEGMSTYEPLSLRNASLYNLRAPRIYLAKAKLSGACLADASLWNADLTDADLTKADLEKANCQHAIFYEATILEAKIGGASLWNANFAHADLREVYGFESVSGLESANFYMTKVSAIPAAILHEKGVKNRVYLLDEQKE